MRKRTWCLVFALLLSGTAFAEDLSGETSEEGSMTVHAQATPRSASSWGVGLSSFQWNDNLQTQQGTNIAKDYANHSGMIFSVQKEKIYPAWGWSAGVFVGSGRANGGGNAGGIINYEKSKVAFLVYGLSPRVFYRLSGRVSAGLTAMAFIKNIDWPKDSANQTIESGQNLNVAGLADLNVRLFSHWDFYSGIGPLSEGATLWKVGFNYRF